MSTTYEWTVEAMECAPTEGENVNVVKVVHWRCNANDETNTATTYGSCSLSEIGESFTAYEDLTKEQVIDWCFASGVNKEETEESLQKHLYNLLHPKSIIKELPF